jgi:choline dehydrogenase-like flavoprotein
MISDVKTLTDATVIQADFCIVGAGAAGISLALGLSRSGYKIVLLEAGGEKEEAEAQALYEGRVVNPALHSPADSYPAEALWRHHHYLGRAVRSV